MRNKTINFTLFRVFVLAAFPCLFFIVTSFHLDEREVLLINEKEMKYGELKLCSKMDKDWLESEGFKFSKSKYLKPRYGTRMSQTFYNHVEGLVLDYDDRVLQRIYIYFPRKDSTLRGIRLGSHRIEVIQAYGKSRSSFGEFNLSYENIDFRMCGDIVCGIELFDQINECGVDN
jgi:hypothetical protein